MKQVRVVCSQSQATVLIESLARFGYQTWFSHIESDGSVAVYFQPVRPVSAPSAEVN
jgi:hypothetical protein